MRRALAIILVLVILFAGCQKTEKTPEIEGTQISLSDKEITVDGKTVTDFGSSGNGQNHIEINGGVGTINLNFKEK